MARKDLLPPNATAFERNMAKALADIEDVQVNIRDLWNPDKCPESWLPFLAWQFSVDYWDQNWPVATKRAAIKASFMIHKKKGTVGAVRRVVETLGFLIRIMEWWQEEIDGEPGTFQLEIGVLDQGITNEMYEQLTRLIYDAKPLSRHMTGLAITMEVRGNNRIFASAYLGDELTVYPYTPETIVSTGYYLTGVAAHTVDTMTIQPLN